MRKETLDFFAIPNNYLKKTFGIRLRKELVNLFVGHIVEKNVLDVGCGDGSLSLNLVGNNRVTFLDSSEEMLEIVRERIQITQLNNAIFFCDTIEDFQPHSNYDLIIIIGVLAHVDNVSEVLLKIKKIAENNAQIIIQFSDFESPLTRFYYFFGKRNKYINKLKKFEILNLLQEYEFSIVDSFKYGLLLPGMGILPDYFLYAYQKFSWKLPFLNFLKSEIIINCKINVV
jgi:ubiquinone/menaquinone biosynthesis C-methylase UbiE